MYCILKNRCPKYDNIPSSCIMVADPNDPNCCQAPQCNNVTAGVQGSITGSGHPPTVNSKYYIGLPYIICASHCKMLQKKYAPYCKMPEKYAYTVKCCYSEVVIQRQS